MSFVCGVHYFCMRLCNLGESDDDSRSGSDAEEQKLWEETQIGKGVKRCPGDQVGELKHLVLCLNYFILSMFLKYRLSSDFFFG